MFIAPNLFLSPKEKGQFEEFIADNISKIDIFLYLVHIPPFDNPQLLAKDYEEYSKFIEFLSIKYQKGVIGFFDDSNINPFEHTFSQKLAEFKSSLEVFIKRGVNIFIRSSKLQNIPLGLIFDNVKVGVLQEPISKVINRVYSKELFWSHLEYIKNPISSSQILENKGDSKYQKRFSIAHPDATNFGDIFYKSIKQSTDKLRCEIDDIYFGREFIYDDGISYFKYGSVMGVNASDEQLDYLFKIQNEFSINISLTLNSTDYDPQILLNPKILKAFIFWLRKFYERGLRVCTISNTHLIKSGILHREFPQMKWKNTVNHKILDAQSFLSYANLGYDFIQLDRSLVRNINELKKISQVNKKLIVPKKLYLLASEFCAYECPFKSEHDFVNERLGNAGRYFSGKTKLSHISCDNWRTAHTDILPRLGVDLFFDSQKIVDEYLKYVDVFKISGRLNNFDSLQKEKDSLILSAFDDKYISFEDAIKADKLQGKLFIKIFRPNKPINGGFDDGQKGRLLTKEGHKLIEHLMKCNNQCYDCHLCEDVFGLAHFNSLVELKNGCC